MTDPEYTGSISSPESYFDFIHEKTPDHGVIIDNGTLIKDGTVTMFEAITDTVTERSVDAGVTVDGIRLRTDVLTIPAITLQSVASTGSETNIPLALIPKGNGALLSSVPDNTSTGGNARGNYAVDLQRNRQSSNQVASGSYAVLTGGQRNRADGDNSFVGSGFLNSVIGDYSSVVGGEENTVSGSDNFVGGGAANSVTGGYSGILSGNTNDIPGYYSAIGSGSSNFIDADGSFIGAGSENEINGTSDDCFIGAGSNNNIQDALTSAIVAGVNNNIVPGSYDSAVLAGNGGIVNGARSAILGGYQCNVNGQDSLAFGTQAQATGNGVVVLSDSQLAAFVNTLADQFNARFSNGYRLTGGAVTISGGLNMAGSAISNTTIPVNVGGTGAITFASGGLLQGNGTSAVTSVTTIPSAVQDNITRTGIITSGVWTGTNIAANRGGTGQSSYAVGDLLYASTTSALSKLAGVTTGNVLISGGVSTAPGYGKVGLTTHVSGVLPAANGGAGPTWYILDKKNNLIQSGTMTAGSNTRTLNTLTGSADTSCTLASNQITLQVGTYDVWARSPVYAVGNHKAVLYNVTSASTDLYGSSSFAPASTQDASIIVGVIQVVTSAKVYEIRQFTELTVAGNGGGRHVGFGDEVYTQVIIRKLA